MSAPACPACGSNRSPVLDSRQKIVGVHRRRQCHECGERFSTIEILRENFEMGRPKTTGNEPTRERLESKVRLMNSNGNNPATIARLCGIVPGTVEAILKQQKEPSEKNETIMLDT